jgi:hypothetical protein
MTALRRTSTRFEASLQAPSARNTANTIGNSSGISEIETVKPARIPATQSSRKSP